MIRIDHTPLNRIHKSFVFVFYICMRVSFYYISSIVAGEYTDSHKVEQSLVGMLGRT